MEEEKSPQILSGFALKVLAFAFMTLDHVGLFLRANESTYVLGTAFRCAGRIALPLILLLAAEGARHSRNVWKYFARLFAVFAALSVFMTFFLYLFPRGGLTPDNTPGNAFADLVLLALTLALLKQKKWLKLLALLPLGFAIMVYTIQLIEYSQQVTVYWLPNYLRPSYSLLGLLIGVGFYFARPIASFLSKSVCESYGIPLEAYEETKSYRRTVNLVGMVAFFVITAAFWGISYLGWEYELRPYDNYVMSIQSYSLLALIPLFFYSGKRGYDSKPARIVTYLYYPVHLAIIFLIFSL